MVLYRWIIIFFGLWLAYLAALCGDGANIVLVDVFSGAARQNDIAIGVVLICWTFLVFIAAALFWWAALFNGFFQDDKTVRTIISLNVVAWLVLAAMGFVIGALTGPVSDYGFDPMNWYSRWNILLFVGALPAAVSFWYTVVDTVKVFKS